MTSTSASPLRLVFMGTAGFAVPSLEALATGPHRLVAVYTQPARPAGRGLRARSSPVESAAARLGLPVRRPESLRDAEAQAALRRALEINPFLAERSLLDPEEGEDI